MAEAGFSCLDQVVGFPGISVGLNHTANMVAHEGTDGRSDQIVGSRVDPQSERESLDVGIEVELGSGRVSRKPRPLLPSLKTLILISLIYSCCLSF